MKALFYLSLVLPFIYLTGIMAGMIMILMGLDPADVIGQKGSEAMAAIGLMTAGFVIICMTLLWKSGETFRTKLWWSVWLVLGNMIMVPSFFWHANKGNLAEAISRKTRTTAKRQPGLE